MLDTVQKEYLSSDLGMSTRVVFLKDTWILRTLIVPGLVQGYDSSIERLDRSCIVILKQSFWLE